MDITVLDNLFDTSQFTQGLKFCEELVQNSALSFQERFQIWIYKVKFLEKLELFEKCLSFADFLLNTTNIAEYPYYRATILTEIAKVHFSKGSLDKVITIVEQAENLLISATTANRTDLGKVKADLLVLRGGYCWQQGNLDDALHYFELNLNFWQKSLQPRPLDLANALNNVGVLYNATGKLTTALVYLEQAYEQNRKMGNTRGVSNTGNNIGAIYVQKGDLKSGLKYMLKSMNFDLKDNYVEGIRASSQNIGEVYWHKHDYVKALHYLEECFSISETIRNEFSITEVCIPLIAVHLELHNLRELNPPRHINNLRKAKQYYECISQISIKSTNKIIHQRDKLARALILKSENTLESRKKAETYLDLIIEDGVRYFDITVVALVTLSEILLTQITLTESESALIKLQQILTQLIDLTQNSNSFSILIETLLIKAKIMLHQSLYMDSHLLFQQALDVVKVNQLQHIEKKILDEYDQFLESLAVLESKARSNQNRLEDNNRVLSKSQSQQIKLKLRNIFAPESSMSSQMAVKQVHRFYFLDMDGNELFQTQFDSDSKWRRDSLFNRIFQIDLLKRFAQFTQNSIEINICNEFKLMFIEGNQMIGCLVYSAPSSWVIDKMEEVRKILADQPFHSQELELRLKGIFSTFSAV
ncbi:MAG: tetratricopeptide repeat protein [Promethearchaeota archaeon]